MDTCSVTEMKNMVVLSGGFAHAEILYFRSSINRLNVSTLTVIHCGARMQSRDRNYALAVAQWTRGDRAVLYIQFSNHETE